MDKDTNKKTERIINLALEIIYLLTGESFPPLKSGDHITIKIPPPHSMIAGRNNEKKILEVTSKIAELLTGEVPIRCQDITVSFSKDEWEYLEDHKDEYNDVLMEDQPALSSPDGATKGIPPETCPSPLYSQDCTPKDNKIPRHTRHDDQLIIKVEVKEEAEEMYIVGDQPYKEMEITPKTVSDGGVCQKTSWKTTERGLISNQDCKQEDDYSAQNSPSEYRSTPDTHSESTDTNPEQHPQSSNTPLLICSECGLSFVKKPDLLAHQKAHTGEIPYSCPLCGKCFVVKTSLNRHLRSHSEERPFKCSECEKSYHTSAELIRHQKLHTGEKPFECKECGRLFVFRDSLRNHQRAHHTGEGTIPCAECGKLFTCQSRISAHMRTHSAEKPFPCTECGERFKFIAQLNRHHKDAHGKARAVTEKPFSCTECGQTFMWKKNLEKHWKIHDGDKTFPCTECGELFMCRAKLHEHESVHTDEKPHLCSECGQCFSSWLKFQEHERVHTGETLILTVESIAPEKKKDKKDKSDRPYPCKHCEKWFPDNFSLSRHQRYHKTVKPYSCSECGECFSAWTKFQEHEKLHEENMTSGRTDGKPFPCDECEKCFYSFNNLLAHQKIHMAAKPHSCAACGTRFKLKTELEQHEATHAL